MNKKLIYVFIFLVLGLFVISACEQIAGRKISSKRVIDGDEGRLSTKREPQVMPVDIIYQNITYNLTTSVNPRGSGRVNPSGGIYQANSTVNLRAIPNLNWTFANWSGDAFGNNSNITIIMNSNKYIIANFNFSG